MVKSLYVDKVLVFFNGSLDNVVVVVCESLNLGFWFLLIMVFVLFDVFMDVLIDKCVEVRVFCFCDSLFLLELLKNLLCIVV